MLKFRSIPVFIICFVLLLSQTANSAPPSGFVSVGDLDDCPAGFNCVDRVGATLIRGNVAIGAKVVMATESTLPADDTTPSVSGDSNWVTANTGATSITRLDDLTACEMGYIRIADANTTFDCTSSNIIGNGGSDYTASSGEIIFYYSPDGTNAYIGIMKPDAGGGDSDAIHDNVPGEIAAIAPKATVVDGDMMMLEDSAASNAKKMVTMTQLWANYFKGKADALYLTAETLSTGAGEINGLSEKASPVSADLVVVEDSEDSNNKKKVQVGNLPGGTDDQTAAEVAVTPAGNIAADDVQEALEELDSEKESHTSNDIDPDRLNGDTVDDNLIDQAIIAGLSSAGVATPGFTAYDSGNPGADKTAGDIYWNDDGTGADGSEDSDWFIRAMIGGTLSDILRYDNSDAQLEATVDLNLAEDLEVATGKHITVGANQWDNGSDKIDGAMIEDDGIDSAQYAAGSIDNEHLADNAVGNDEMADDAITMAEIDDDGNFTSLTGDWETTGYSTGQAKTTLDASGGITLTVNAVNRGTDTGDADIPDGACDDAGDVGNWVVLISSAADAYSLTSLDASNQFIITADAAALTADNELDVDGTMVCVMCIAAELWKVTGYMGDIPTDGGAAD